ncbi:MAG: MerR family transcriptional regulator [Saprospiraceae bacterium]
MAVYSIRDLEKLTGIKTHTIRIWEQRYSLIQPARTQTNIRYYTDENLRELFNIALLNRHGYRISSIAAMSSEQIAARVAEITDNNLSANAQIDALTLAMIKLDEAAFEQVFSSYEWEHGFERTVLELVYPFLDKLNVLWLTNSISPAHEKFITHLFRRKLIGAIEKESGEPARDSASFLLYLPENEAQELTLLYIHYILRKRRQKVVFLGSGINLNDLSDACGAIRPNYVMTLLHEPLSRISIQKYLDLACQTIGQAALLVSGAQLFVSRIEAPQNAYVLNGLPDLLKFLQDLPSQNAKKR